MKSAFRQQASEHDCVPTSFINALSLLFEREEIPPPVVQRTYLYTLDLADGQGCSGNGTTAGATRLLCNWLAQYRGGGFRLRTRFISGRDVHLMAGSAIAECLAEHGATLVRVRLGEGESHMILGLSTDADWFYAFDSKPRPSGNGQPGQYEFIEPTGPQAPNLRIARSWLCAPNSDHPYQFGAIRNRRSVLLSRG